MTAFRVQGRVHWGLLPGLALNVLAVVVGVWALILGAPGGLSNIRWLGGCVLVAGAFVVLLGFSWQAVIAYGVLPFVVVWRRGGMVWAGTLPALLGFSRRRIALGGGGISVFLSQIHKARDGSPMVFDVQIKSAERAITVPSRGAVDTRSLSEFLTGSVAAMTSDRPSGETESV